MKLGRIIISGIVLSLAVVSAQASSVLYMEIFVAANSFGPKTVEVLAVEQADDSVGLARVAIRQERFTSLGEADENPEENPEEAVSGLALGDDLQMDGIIVNGGFCRKICTRLTIPDLTYPRTTIISIRRFFSNILVDTSDINGSTWMTGDVTSGDTQGDNSDASNAEMADTGASVESDFAVLDAAHSMLLKPVPMLLLSFAGLAVIGWRRWRTVLSPVRRR